MTAETHTPLPENPDLALNSLVESGASREEILSWAESLVDSDLEPEMRSQLGRVLKAVSLLVSGGPGLTQRAEAIAVYAKSLLQEALAATATPTQPDQTKAPAFYDGLTIAVIADMAALDDDDSYATLAHAIDWLMLSIAIHRTARGMLALSASISCLPFAGRIVSAVDLPEFVADGRTTFTADHLAHSMRHDASLDQDGETLALDWARRALAVAPETHAKVLVALTGDDTQLTAGFDGVDIHHLALDATKGGNATAAKSTEITSRSCLALGGRLIASYFGGVEQTGYKGDANGN